MFGVEAMIERTTMDVAFYCLSKAVRSLRRDTVLRPLVPDGRARPLPRHRHRQGRRQLAPCPFVRAAPMAAS